MDGVKTFYFPRRRVKARPELTLLVRPYQEGYHYAMALCCPKDNFSKALGRRIAGGRLLSLPWYSKTGAGIAEHLEDYLKHIALRRPDILERIGMSEFAFLEQIHKYFS